MSADYSTAKCKSEMAGGESPPCTRARFVYTRVCKRGLRGSAEESGAPADARQVSSPQSPDWLLIKEPSAAAQRQNSSQRKVTCNDDPSRWI